MKSNKRPQSTKDANHLLAYDTSYEGTVTHRSLSLLSNNDRFDKYNNVHLNNGAFMTIMATVIMVMTMATMTIMILTMANNDNNDNDNDNNGNNDNDNDNGNNDNNDNDHSRTALVDWDFCLCFL